MKNTIQQTAAKAVFEQLEPVDQEFYVNDFEPVRFRDRYNHIKEHIFKRVDGLLYYAQVVEYQLPSRTYVYSKTEAGVPGFTKAHNWQTGADSHGYLTLFLEHLRDDRKRYYKRGQFLQTWSNQAYRDAEVLVVDTERRLALCEFEMPKGTTALFVIDSYTGEEQRCNFSYRRLPKRWAKLMEEQNVRWIGQSQGSSEPVPLPY